MKASKSCETIVHLSSGLSDVLHNCLRSGFILASLLAYLHLEQLPCLGSWWAGLSFEILKSLFLLLLESTLELLYLWEGRGAAASCLLSSLYSVVHKLAL